MRSAFRLPERLSLRTRLVLLLVALAVVGLAVADFASYRALHSYLYDRVDQQLQSAVMPLTINLIRETEAEEKGETEAGALPAPPNDDRIGGGGPGGLGPASQLPPGTFGQLRNAA